jgi:Protein of unknown function (DUF3617)
MQRLFSTSAVAIATLMLAYAANAAEGERWEITTTIDAQGKSMPIGTFKTCQAASASLKPRLAPNCKLEEFKPSGNKASFRAVCGPPQPSTMSGEMTRNGDTVSGTLRLQQNGHDMLMKQAARKLGSCADPTD